MKRKAVNAVSMFPYSIGPLGPIFSILIAKLAGFDGIQAYPMKGWVYKWVEKWAQFVITFEDAFLYGSLWEAILRHLGKLTEPAPLLWDWLLFGMKDSYPFASSIKISHEFCRGCVVEVSPELSTDVEEYLSFVENGGLLCLDTLHLVRHKRDESSGIENWYSFVHALPENCVSVIHIHPEAKDVKRLLSGESFALTEMIHLLTWKFPQADLVFEVFPRFKDPISLIFFFKRLRLAVEKHIYNRIS